MPQANLALWYRGDLHKFAMAYALANLCIQHVSILQPVSRQDLALIVYKLQYLIHS